MSGGVVRNVLHGLEPVVGVAELGNDQGIVRVAVKTGELEPMLVSSKFGFYLQLLSTMTVSAGTRKKKIAILFSSDVTFSYRY
jgi:hypothetical protein